MATRLSNAYLLTKVLTANKHEVVVYLYEGAIGYVHRAMEAMRAGQRGLAGQSIDRAVSILIELSGGLNYTTGGHLALRLDAIYSYLIESLTLANSRGDVAALESCDSILAILYDAWQQAAAASASRKPAPKKDSQLQVSA